MSALAYDPRVTPEGPRLRERPAVYERTLKDKSYRRSVLGQEVGRFLRALRWSEHSDNTINSYETTLSRLSVDHDDWSGGADDFCSPVGTEYIREFLDRHWGDASPATRRQRLAAVKSFFEWALNERLVAFNPAASIRPPKTAASDDERIAYPVAVLLRLVRGQDSLRDQCALQFLCRMAFRKDELRQLKVGEIDLHRDLVIVHGKGRKTKVLPLDQFPSLTRDLYLHIQGENRHPNEYLLYPRARVLRPMDPSSVHRWFKNRLVQAGLSETIKMHEMRHSAADHVWRGTGDIVMAQQLLRHSSVATTQAYLHPDRRDLADAMRRLEPDWETN